MKPDSVLIRYGEIGLKAKSTRKHFERILINNMKNALDNNAIAYSITSTQGRIFIQTEFITDTIETISHVFGITSLSPVYSLPTDMEKIKKNVLSLITQSQKPGKSFALRVTRSGTHEFTSQDVAVEVGAFVQKDHDFPVNLTKPDLELHIEIRDNKTYLFLEKITGPGGMPMGSQGKVISIVLSKNDLLASWFLLKRGCTVIYIFQNKELIKMCTSFFEKWHITNKYYFIDKNKEFWKNVQKTINKKKCQALSSGITLSTESKDQINEIFSIKEKIKIPILTPLISFSNSMIDTLIQEKGIDL